MSALRVKDLKVGMKLKDNIIGAKNDIKVRGGEVLSALHVEKLNKWNKGGLVDGYNKNGFETEATLKSGSALPDVVDHPEMSPVVNAAAKEKLGKSMRVPVDIKDGKIIRDEESEEGTDEPGDSNPEPEPSTEPAKKRGRKPKKQ